MPKKAPKVVYTARNFRAENIELAAEGYPEGELKVTVLPIHDEKSAKEALAIVAARNKTENECITDELWKPVEERYAELGQTGTDSLVVMELGEEVGKFDFGALYAQVDEVTGIR